MEGLIKPFSYKGVITDNTDFDELTVRGFYRINASKLLGNNAPVVQKGFGSILIVDNDEDPNLLTSQIVIESNNSVIHTRRKTTNGWVDWSNNV